MQNKINSLLINEKDNVAVALEELVENNIASYKTNKKVEYVTLLQSIPIYHKFSVTDIKEGQLVYKYGEVIGRASKNIKRGEHIHSHNLVSIRELIED